MFTDRVNPLKPLDSPRFSIFILIPESIKSYFLSSDDWNNYTKNQEADYLLTDLESVSTIPNGFKTRCYPSTHSVFYKPPYFIQFKTSIPSIPKNYLSFQELYQSNVEQHVIAMLEYNKNDDFFIRYPLKVSIPYHKSLTLTKTLEFVIIDSENTQIPVKDGSEMFIALSL